MHLVIIPENKGEEWEIDSWVITMENDLNHNDFPHDKS